MAGKTRWVVTTTGEGSLGEIKNKLSAAGFVVDQVFGEIGCITGTASDDVVHTLRGIHGVDDVSPENPIDIGPPDAPVTW